MQIQRNFTYKFQRTKPGKKRRKIFNFPYPQDQFTGCLVPSLIPAFKGDSTSAYAVLPQTAFCLLRQFRADAGKSAPIVHFSVNTAISASELAQKLRELKWPRIAVLSKHYGPDSNGMH